MFIKIIQVLSSISVGDAVSNDALNIDKYLTERNYTTEIYSEIISDKLKNKVKHIDELREVTEKDLIIYHKAIGSKLSYELKKYPCKKIMRYHNITPERFFKNYNAILCSAVNYGRVGLKFAKDYISGSISDSEYNKRELLEIGYKNNEVFPVLISFEDYKKNPDEKIITKYKDYKKNILFVGRIAPNKKQEDVIKSFYFYKKYVNKDSRLILVGNYSGFEKYFELLKKLVKKLKIEKDVVFTGHIKFEEIIAYYKIADLFLCMSEHEGFCVPLVEAMYFDIPIIAYESSAISETLRKSGIILNKKDYFLISELINEVLVNYDLREEIIKKQRTSLKYYMDIQKTEKLIQIIEKIIQK